MAVSTWVSTDARSWRSASTGGGSGGWRTDNSRVYQGQWENFGHHRGLWFFNDANIRTVLNNRSITRVRVQLTRFTSGGAGAGQVPTIRMHNYSTQPTGTPTMGAGNSSHGVSWAWGETKWVTLPATSWGNSFRDGQARGIGLYTTSDTPYMIFQPTATLEITHEAIGPEPVQSIVAQGFGSRIGFPAGMLDVVTPGLNVTTVQPVGTEIAFQPFTFEVPTATVRTVGTSYHAQISFGNPVMQTPGSVNVPDDLALLQEGADVIVSWKEADNVNHYVVHSRTPSTGEVFDPYNFNTQVGNTSGTTFRHRSPGAGQRDYQVFGILASLDLSIPPLPINFRFGDPTLVPLQGGVPDLGYPYGNFQIRFEVAFPAPNLEDVESSDMPLVSPLPISVNYAFNAPNLVPTGQQDQFFTDFENTAIGAVPSGWTQRVGSGFSVQNVTLSSGQVVKMLTLVATEGNTTRFLSWDLANGEPNVEILARCAFSAGSNEQNTVYMRTAANPNDQSYHGLYYSQQNNTLVSIERNLSGWSRLGSVNKPTLPTANQMFLMRFRVNGNQQKLKIWGTGTAEPANWDVETTDGGITAGGFNGLGAWAGGKTYYFDWVGIGLRGAEAPSFAPGAPAQLTATMPTTFRFGAANIESVPVVGQAVTLNSFTISANSSGVPTANWSITTNQSVNFDPIVVALRNSADANLDFGHQWVTVNNTTQSMNATRAALPGGDYTAWIAYNRAGAWTDLAPVRSFTGNGQSPTPPPGGGAATRNPDLPSSYNITWRDEFEGSSINWNRWRPWGYSQGECQRGNFNVNGQLEWNQADNPNNAFIQNNTLRMRAIRQNVNQCGRTYSWTGAHLNTQPSLIFQRNIYLEARLRVEGSASGIKAGFWPAFWTWQADGVNTQQEIDIWEYWSGWSAGERYSVNTHGSGSFGGWGQVIWWRDHGPTRAYDWNTYGCWIRENDIWLYLNNKRIAVAPRRVTVNCYVIINLAVERNNPPPSSVNNFWMDWDWVRAWRP